MADWQLERLRLSTGTWEGRLSGPPGAEPPPLVALWHGGEIAPVRAHAAGAGVWTVVFEVPREVMTDGVQTLAIGEPDAAPLLIDALAFGDPLAADLRAEVAALRTEVGLLRRALRRHLAQGD
jgi:hypothetical protein